MRRDDEATDLHAERTVCVLKVIEGCILGARQWSRALGLAGLCADEDGADEDSLRVETRARAALGRSQGWS